MTAPNNEFNWFEFPIGGGQNKWRVRPTAVGTDNTPWDSLTPADIAKTNNPPTANRNQNTIKTYCEEFADFNLKFSFVSPNAKATFTLCTNANPTVAKVKGPQNWGNSGVKIFNLSATGGLEVQIHDSQSITAAIPSIDDVATNTGLNGCTLAQPGHLPFGQMCGSIYMKKVARRNTVNATAGWPVPTGSWNTFEIGFMAARYDAGGNRVRCPTITVKINGTAVLRKIGIANSMTNAREDDVYTHGPNKGAPLYCAGWKREKGPIFLQEHDNMVEFKEIEINPGYLFTVLRWG